MRPLDNVKINPSHLTYYLFITALVFNGSLSDTLLPGYADGLLQNLLVMASFGFLFLHLIFLQHRRSFLLTILMVAGIGLATYLFGGRTGLLFTLLAVLLGRGMDLDKLLKMVFWQKLIIFCLIVLMSIAGFLPGAEVLKTGVSDTTKGYTLGYIHSNTFAATAGMLLLLYAAINRYRLNLIRLGIILVGELIAFRLTHSKTGVMIMGVFLLGVLCLGKRTSKVFLKLSGWILPAILAVNVIMILWSITAFSPQFTKIDDKLFTGRMFLSSMYLRTYPLTLFGAELDESLIKAVLHYYALDNGYTVVLLHYGIVGFVFFLTAVELIFLYLAKKNQPILVLIALCFCMWTVYEGIVLSVSGNFIFLCFGKLIQQDTNAHRLRIAW